MMYDGVVNKVHRVFLNDYIIIKETRVDCLTLEGGPLPYIKTFNRRMCDLNVYLRYIETFVY